MRERETVVVGVIHSLACTCYYSFSNDEEDRRQGRKDRVFVDVDDEANCTGVKGAER